MLHVLVNNEHVAACAASVHHLQLTAEVVASVAGSGVARCLQGQLLDITLLRDVAVGDTVGLPVVPLPQDPAAALEAVVASPLVGAQVVSRLDSGDLETVVSRWPVASTSFGSAEEARWFMGRKVSLQPPPDGRELVAVAIRLPRPDEVFRPVGPGGKKRAVCDARTDMCMSSDEVGDDRVLKREGRQSVQRFFFIDDDGVTRELESKADFSGRYEAARGLLRVWAGTRQFRFFRDLVLDWPDVYQAAVFSAGCGFFLVAAGVTSNWFPLARRVQGASFLTKPDLFQRVVSARWRFSDHDRLRLVDIAEDPMPWPSAREHAAQPSARRRLRHVLQHLGAILAAIWDEAFLRVFDPFVTVLDASPNQCEDYTVIYLVSRVEHALAAFAEAVFGPPTVPLPPVEARLVRVPASWASELRSLVVSAADPARWEAAPTWRFFAFDGEWYRFFRAPGEGSSGAANAPPRGEPPSAPSKASLAPTSGAGPPSSVQPRPSGDEPQRSGPKEKPRVCFGALGSWLKAVDSDGKPVFCAHGESCSFSHSKRAFQRLKPAQLAAVVASSKPPLRTALETALSTHASSPSAAAKRA